MGVLLQSYLYFSSIGVLYCLQQSIQLTIYTGHTTKMLDTLFSVWEECPTMKKRPEKEEEEEEKTTHLMSIYTIQDLTAGSSGPLKYLISDRWMYVYALYIPQKQSYGAGSIWPREKKKQRERERKAKKLVELLDGRLTHKSDFLLPAEAAPQIASHNDERI